MIMNVSNAMQISNSLRITCTCLKLLMAQFTREVVVITLLKIDLMHVEVEQGWWVVISLVVKVNKTKYTVRDSSKSRKKRNYFMNSP